MWIGCGCEKTKNQNPVGYRTGPDGTGLLQHRTLLNWARGGVQGFRSFWCFAGVSEEEEEEVVVVAANPALVLSFISSREEGEEEEEEDKNRNSRDQE